MKDKRLLFETLRAYASEMMPDEKAGESGMGGLGVGR